MKQLVVDVLGFQPMCVSNRGSIRFGLEGDDEAAVRGRILQILTLSHRGPPNHRDYPDHPEQDVHVIWILDDAGRRFVHAAFQGTSNPVFTSPPVLGLSTLSFPSGP